MYEYLNSNSLYAEQQYDFCTNHSTEYAAGKLVDTLSKAFDTIAFDILLYKLNYYGIKDNVFTLLKNYLTNQKQYVVSNSQNSKTDDITTGAPQGSILEPLFLSYI